MVTTPKHRHAEVLPSDLIGDDDGPAMHPTRRRRTNDSAPPPPTSPEFRYQPQADQDADVAALKRLADRASKGDPAALDELRAALDELPHVWQRIGDLMPIIEARVAAAAFGEDVAKLESLRRRAAALRVELTRGMPSMLVSMAVSRVVACWLLCQLADLDAIEHRDPASAKRAAQMERRHAAALRNYELAIKLETWRQSADASSSQPKGGNQ